MNDSRRYPMSAAACALCVALVGCAQVAGIDQPPTNPNSSGVSALCGTYCDTVMGACPDPFYVYASREMCLGVCNKLELAGKTGSPSDQSGDTIYCRLYYAQQAAGTGEKVTCPQAGPGGSGICGSNCEAYCILMQQTCPTEFKDPNIFNDNLSNCITLCGGIPTADAGFNADQISGNTINCRLYHVSAANATPDAPTTHCPHAAGIPGKTPCVDP